MPKPKIPTLLFLMLFLSLSLKLRPDQADSRVEIYNLRHHTHPSYTRIVIDIGKLREYTSNQLPSPDRVYVDIYQAKLNPILHGRVVKVQNDYIDRIRIAQKNTTTVRAVVDLNFDAVKRYDVFPLPDPFRIVIDIYPKDPPARPSTPETSQPAKPTQTGYSLVRQLGLGIQRIVIDPGHGGKDPGCIGKKGSYEKNIVLDVCERLKKLLLQHKGLEIILTRETDIFVPPENRVVIANQKQADIFLSIHANSYPNRKRAGVETYYLNFSQDPDVLKVAAAENVTTTKNISQQREILEKIIRTNKLMESRDLANKIQRSLVTRLASKYQGVRNLGVKGGPFWVLIGGEMPSILVEVSHLSNPQEEDRLNTAKYRQTVAQGIYEGILQYIKSLGKG
ncbi:MAG: N-acetylmuramoyl-L-alanine amidase [Candidatus Aminicenantes bacterium]|jgi:N-acetylmuramoyl-L-alanine amidase